MLTPAPVLRMRGLPHAYAWLDYERCVFPGVCGNKARKLATLDLAAGDRVVSHGGAQSNALVALANLCHHRGAMLTYHTKPLPRWLREQPVGNLRQALRLGTILSEHASASAYDDAVAQATRDESTLFVPQGAAWPSAERGVADLAAEISAWWEQEAGRPPVTAAAAPSPPPPLSVVVPAGTGTTALFLARHAPPWLHVHAVPCVGGAASLHAQTAKLDAASGGVGRFPRTLLPPPALRTPFAAPSVAALEQWRHAATAHGLLLDLVYGPIAWGTLAHSGFALTGRPTDATLYVHCGGLEGLGTSLRRYQRSGLLRAGESAEAALTEARKAAAVAPSEAWFADAF